VSGRSGFRKSHHPLLGRFGVRRAPRTPAHLLPDWRLSFTPPTSFTWHLAPGPFPGVIGATVSELGQIEIVGKRKDFVIAQAALAWSKLCRDRHCREVSAVLARGDEPGPTLSGPIRKGESITCKLEFDNHTTVMVWGTTLRKVAYPVPMMGGRQRDAQ
jgi:hypothetical protein